MIGLGDGTTNYVVVSNGQGVFLFTPGGLAGQLSATVTVQNIPDVSFAGTFRIKLNTTSTAVIDSFVVDGKAVNLNVPAGPYLGSRAGSTRTTRPARRSR